MGEAKKKMFDSKELNEKCKEKKRMMRNCNESNVNQTRNLK